MSFTSQNCQSLNISTKNQKTGTKIHALLKGGEDFIFLSDIRLNSNKQNYAVHDLEKKFLSKGYHFYHNSKISSRGVGILINKQIKFNIIEISRDEEYNFILLKINIEGSEFIIGSVYGPNTDNTTFYETLELALKKLKRNNVVLGGDWNATWDCRDAEQNLDVINMADIPSKNRSRKIQSLSKNFSLTDPYRIFNPVTRDFTYIPNARMSVNRSRLDFFLISETIAPFFKNCQISYTNISSLFDHKSISLTSKCKIPKNISIVRDQILKNVDLNHRVKASVFECYLHNAISLEPNDKNTLLTEIGHIQQKIKENSDLEFQIAGIGNEIGLIDIIENNRIDIQETFDRLPELEFFEGLELECQNDSFFESLLMCIKNDSLSQQSSFFQIKSLRKKTLANELKELKKNYNVNDRNILEKERKLSQIIELELKTELSNIRNFERLTDEKLTPYFLTMAKKSSPTANLCGIKNSEGNAFESEGDRSEYISNFYSDLYKKPVNDQIITQQDILQFLGPVSNVPEVISSKLTAPEKEDLDRDFTINELDTSIKNANLNSASGPDGISNKFIKHFWNFFRVPLFKYARCTYEKGVLTNTFRTAKIRLIPKKGNAEHIKNWRPISLLNCFYKIISRALSFRIKKYMDRITKVGQKGYSTTKQCQEVLISIIDEIQKCKNSGKKGAIISLDIKKAFDSLSHSFLKQSLIFFNFGPNIIRWLMLISTGRSACIILENEIFGRIFELERGNAQGDTISPFLFNIGYQILLLKLNFDLQIIGFTEVLPIPPHLTPLPPSVSTYPRKVYALADDNTVLCNLDFSSINRVKTILEEYFEISGLQCNVEKSFLMPIGNEDPLPAEITDIGFTISNELTVLGLILDSVNSNFTKSVKKIKDKITSQINFWSRFNLSLPGRINIAKSMMYSQINYLGSFLPFNTVDVQSFEKLITDYVGGNLKIAYKRFFTPIEHSGLGLFKMDNFLAAQKCSWLRRALSLDELWKQKIYVKSYGNILNVRAKLFDKNTEPIIYEIVSAYENFYNKLCKNKLFYRKAFIFDNPAFTTGLQGNQLIKATIFGENIYAQNRGKIEMLKFSDFYNGERRLTNAELNTELGFTVTQAAFLNISGMIACAEIRYGRGISNRETIHIGTFVSRGNTGSRKYRKIMDEFIQPNISHNINTFARTTEIVIDYKDSMKVNSMWWRGYFSNSTRTFLFKLYNNTLGLKHRIAHFVREYINDNNCTFCNLTQNPDIEPETALHFFWDCRTVEELRLLFFNWLLEENFFEISRREFFSVFKLNNNFLNEILNISCRLFMKFLWDCRLRSCVPQLLLLKNYIKTEFCIMKNINGAFERALIGSNINIERE